MKQKLPGFLILIIGALFMYQSSDLNWGTITKLGPGFWPSILSIILMVIGIAMVIINRFEHKDDQLKPLPILTLILSMTVYLAVITEIGLVLTAVLILVISLAARPDGLGYKTVMYAAMVLFSVIIFLLMIGIDTPLWPNF